MAILKIPLQKIILGAPGACISCGMCSYKQEIMCAAAGPGASILLCFCTWRLQADLAIITALLGIFNLLPLYPLDGGRILRAALLCHMEESKARKAAERVTALVCLLLMVGACSAAAWMQMGLWPIFASLAVLWKAGTVKE